MYTFFEKIRLKFAHRFLSRWTILFLDLLLVYGTFWLAQWIRYDFEAEFIPWREAYYKSFLLLLVYGLWFTLFKSYVGVVRHSGSQDFLRLTHATLWAVATLWTLSGLTQWLVLPGFELNHTALVVQSMSFLILSVGGRLAVRSFFLEVALKKATSADGIVIFGAGSMGRATKSALEQEVKLRPKVVAYLDDNTNKIDKSVNGVPIYAPEKGLHQEFVDKHQLTRLIIAVKNITAKRVKEITEMGLALGLEVRKVPPISSWVNGELTAKQIRSVSLEELLGRDPIHLSYATLNGFLKDKKILVTGAAGSIGSELVRQLLRQSPQKVIALDQAETPIYHLDLEMHSKGHNSTFTPVIASVNDWARMEWVFKTYSPDVVFHAAAYKHVPLMEDNPQEAIKTNTLGTDVVAQLAYQHGCDAFVMVSTDKAVNPTNVMGASKRLAEHVVGYYNGLPNNKTRFVTTRFGNVLGSNGSVIPLFKRQIEEGGPLTITHKNITRYFMTIPEAVRLVLEAGHMGKGGELFVFDMGEPVRIYDLALHMIKLSGLTPGKDIAINVVGLRPGEKLYEELLADTENTKKTHHPKIFVADTHQHPSSYFQEHFNILRENHCNSSKQLELLRVLVPEFVG